MRSSDVTTLPFFFLASLQTKATSKEKQGVQTDGDQVKKGGKCRNRSAGGGGWREQMGHCRATGSEMTADVQRALAASS